MERRAKALRAAGDSEEFRQPGVIEDLMGRARYLWEHKEGSKKEIVTLEAQRQELEIQRAQGVTERLHLRNQIKELTEEREELLQQLGKCASPAPFYGPRLPGDYLQELWECGRSSQPVTAGMRTTQRGTGSLPETSTRTTICKRGTEHGFGASYPGH